MMSITACSLLVAATLTGGSASVATTGAPALVATVVSEAPGRSFDSTGPAGATTPAAVPEPSLRAAPALPEAWTLDRPVSGRPAALPVMYAALGGLQAFDIYSTRRAISGGGAQEANPLMKQAAGRSGMMLAAKALSTAGTIYFAERLWKKNRKGAMILMAVINGATGVIAMRNMKHTR
jgi:uncharacterized protein DUF5658